MQAHESFSSLPNLKTLSVEQTMLSEAGIQRLRECAAEAQIHFGQLMSSQTRRAFGPLARLRATVYRNSSAEVYMVDLRDLKDATAAIPCVFELRETLTDLRLGKHATDQLLADLKQLPTLSTVDLSDSQLSNAGLSHLKGCPQLKTLVLQRCIVDNAGLASILAVPDLAELVLNGSSLPKGAYAKIGSMPQLRRLEFSKSSISDSDLAHLARLPNLNCLVLDHTKITAQGVKQLETHVHLEKLSLVGTKVTDNDLRQLREAIPECEFVLQ